VENNKEKPCSNEVRTRINSGNAYISSEIISPIALQTNCSPVVLLIMERGHLPGGQHKLQMFENETAQEHTLACIPIPRQQPRNKRLYNSRC
jgi:hypothetical protein